MNRELFIQKLIAAHVTDETRIPTINAILDEFEAADAGEVAEADGKPSAADLDAHAEEEAAQQATAGDAVQDEGTA